MALAFKPRSAPFSANLTGAEWRWFWDSAVFALPLFQDDTNVVTKSRPKSGGIPEYTYLNVGYVADMTGSDEALYEANNFDLGNTPSYSVAMYLEADTQAFWDTFGGFVAKTTAVGGTDNSFSIQRDGSSSGLVVFHGNLGELDLNTTISNINVPKLFGYSYDSPNNTLDEYLNFQRTSHTFTDKPSAGPGDVNFNGARLPNFNGSARYFWMVIAERYWSPSEWRQLATDPFGPFRTVDDAPVIFSPPTPTGAQFTRRYYDRMMVA